MSKDLIQEFIDYQKQKRNSKGKLRSVHTISNYELQLRKYEKAANSIDANKRKRDKFILNTPAYLFKLKSSYGLSGKGNTFKTHVSIINSFFDFLYSEKEYENLPQIDWKALKKAVNVNKAEKTCLNEKELEKLKEFLKTPGNVSARDRLLFEIGLKTAARRSEIRNIRNCDVYSQNYTNGEKGYFIKLLRKGKDTRESQPIHEDLYDLIQEFKGDVSNDNFLFPSKKAAINEGLNLSYITQLIKRVSKKALGYSVSPHELRHTAINQIIIFNASNGVDLDTAMIAAQKLAGHSDRNTTEQHYFNDEVKGMFNTLSQDSALLNFMK